MSVNEHGEWENIETVNASKVKLGKALSTKDLHGNDPDHPYTGPLALGGKNVWDGHYVRTPSESKDVLSQEQLGRGYTG